MGCCFDNNEEYHELYLHEILEGKVDEEKGLKFKGVYPLIREFMKDRQYEPEDVEQINHFMDFLLARAKGEVKTGARYQREFVLNHASY